MQEHTAWVSTSVLVALQSSWAHGRLEGAEASATSAALLV